MLEWIENEIRYCALPIQELIDLLSKQEELNELSFIKKCKEYEMKNKSFSMIWRKSIESSNIGLNVRDKNLLYSFGDMLGTTDIIGQINICKLHLSLFEKSLNEAESIKEKWGSTTIKIGASFGLFIAIVLY